MTVEELVSNTEVTFPDQDAIADQRRRRMAEELSKPVNTTGECSDCEESIDPRRLDINPRVERCVTCAQVQEDELSRRRRRGY